MVVQTLSLEFCVAQAFPLASRATSFQKSCVVCRARCPRQTIIEVDQVVVFIQRDVVGQRIIGTLRYLGRISQRLGKVAREREARRSQRKAAQKTAAL